MLPPIPLSTLQTNSQFAALHKHLTTHLLNPDGSQKLSPKEAKTQATINKDLENAQTAFAKTVFLKSNLPYLLTSDLPDELQDLITILISSPSPTPSPLLPIDPTPLCPLLTPHLLHLLKSLSLIASPETPTTTSSDTLPSQIITRRSTLARSNQALDASRLSLVTSLSTLSQTHRQILDLAIPTLESTKHGSIPRALCAESTYLRTVACGLAEGKLPVLKEESHAAIYTPEVRAAVEAYMEHLEKWRENLGERGERAEDELEGFESWVGGEEIRTVYAELRGKVERVRGEIRRLGGEI